MNLSRTYIPGLSDQEDFNLREIPREDANFNLRENPNFPLWKAAYDGNMELVKQHIRTLDPNVTHSLLSFP
jgi:hypothetical protein